MLSPIVFFLQGTNIASGKCVGIVIGTGLDTEIGEYPLSMLSFSLSLSCDTSSSSAPGRWVSLGTREVASCDNVNTAS